MWETFSWIRYWIYSKFFIKYLKQSTINYNSSSGSLRRLLKYLYKSSINIIIVVWVSFSIWVWGLLKWLMIPSRFSFKRQFSFNVLILISYLIDYNYEKLYSRAEREATQYIQWLERRCWLDPMCLRKKIVAMFFHRYINFMA